MKFAKYFSSPIKITLMSIIILVGLNTQISSAQTASNIDECYLQYVQGILSSRDEYQACVEAIYDRCREAYPTSADRYTECIRGTGTQLDLTEGLTQCGVDSAGRPIYVSVDIGCDANSTNPIMSFLNAIINFLAAGVGIVVVTMLAKGGYQYITSGGSPQKIETAKSTITNALMALLAFIFLYAILQWLIPGGLFNAVEQSPPTTRPGVQ